MNEKDYNELVARISSFVREHKIVQGDHYGTWIDASPDAEALAEAIEDKFFVK